MSDQAISLIFRCLLFSVLAILGTSLSEVYAQEEQAARGRLDPAMGKETTYITSDALSLNTIKRVFSYQGNVKVTQGDLTLESDRLQGKYSENNELQSLEAAGNVVITRGDDIEARSNRAIYDNANQVVTLSENPELRQNGGTLTADVIRIFLDEDRSVAEGEVRMRLEGQEQQTGTGRRTSLPLGEGLAPEPGPAIEASAIEASSPSALP
jgi:lipopolysaccharide export system protein LptA